MIKSRGSGLESMHAWTRKVIFRIQFGQTPDIMRLHGFVVAAPGGRGAVLSNSGPSGAGYSKSIRGIFPTGYMDPSSSFHQLHTLNALQPSSEKCRYFSVAVVHDLHVFV